MSGKGKLSYKFMKNDDWIMIVCSKNNQLCSNIADVYLLISYTENNFSATLELSKQDVY